MPCPGPYRGFAFTGPHRPGTLRPMSYFTTTLAFRTVVAFFTLAGGAASHWHWSGWVAGFVVGLVFASAITETAPAWLADVLYPPDPFSNDERAPITVPAHAEPVREDRASNRV
jgi:hypothetical protein